MFTTEYANYLKTLPTRLDVPVVSVVGVVVTVLTLLSLGVVGVLAVDCDSVVIDTAVVVVTKMYT